MIRRVLTPVIAPLTLALALVLGAGAIAPAPSAGQPRTGVTCQIKENGQAASGTVSLRQNGREIGAGACNGDVVSVPAGSYDAVLRLDGALDRPEQTRQVTVRAGGASAIEADFATAILEVRIMAQGRRAAGMAVLYRNGTRVGQIGSGVSAHVSAGTYDVVAQYRNNEQRFDGVALVPGQRRSLSAEF
jgi:hypothetical protein